MSDKKFRMIFTVSKLAVNKNDLKYCKLHFSNGDVYTVYIKDFIKKEFYADIPFNIYLNNSYLFKYTDITYAIELVNNCSFYLNDFSIVPNILNTISFTNNLKEISGSFICANKNPTKIICKLNGNSYDAYIENNTFVFKIPYYGFLLDFSFTIEFLLEDKVICSQEFQTKEFQTKISKKGFTYFFSKDVKLALNAEVFLFKSVYLQKNYSLNVLNLLSYRSSVDRNIAYVLAIYIAAYYNKPAEFVKVIKEVVNYEKNNESLSLNNIIKTINTNKKLQNSILLDIDLWNKLLEFVKKVNSLTGIPYSRHTIINIMFTDYYQVHKNDIKNNVNTFFDKIFDAEIFTKRGKDLNFKSIAEKEQYFLNKS